MFISFEGIDGSGKSTQIKLLCEKLLEEGYEVEVFREPGGTDISEQIRHILLNSKSEIDPVTEMLLFSAARSQLIAGKVLPLLEKGTVVILDRFYDSTTAYQGYGRKAVSLEQIRELNEMASHRRKPDLTFYLRISLEEAKKRTESLEKDRMEISGDEFFSRVIEGYDKLAETEERFVTIDASADLQATHALVWKQVQLRLKRKQE